ncbi:ArsC family reductase [Vibrio sp. ZSDZ34]|jgi:Spx/MgsR family transcriptional regulator|uniref:ArsC family reductase n=1 Tax=Vibrio gelatinilyticus TaxID=2893468 RepID=A0A9X1WCH1_9VIBR|nr:ArsC family reductase [Vibrio gelatinilyticus]MCJ2377761.1 ArsC family reductase [Vibrio gelatinilyticus]
MIRLYGLSPSTCDTVKKAKKWLDSKEIAFEIHDYRKAGIDDAMLRRFCDALDWEQVINKRGTTYRKLPQEQKDTLTKETAIALMLEQPAMIKRPILDIDGALYIGFKAEQYSTIFQS